MKLYSRDPLLVTFAHQREREALGKPGFSNPWRTLQNEILHVVKSRQEAR